MNEKRRVLAINGSYRDGGMTDQVVENIIEDLQALDADVEHIRLRDFPIEFCRNCRECMQQPGDEPGRCILNDGMGEIVKKIEAADAYILAAPTNFSAVTALFKRFAERLSPYGYWPWGKPAPVFRKSKLTKKPAIIIRVVVFPDPLGPSSVKKLPGSTEKVTSSTALTDPKCFARDLTSTLAPRILFFAGGMLDSLIYSVETIAAHFYIAIFL